LTTSLDTAGLRERLIALTRDLVLIPGTEKRPDELHRSIEWVGNHLESLEGVTVHSYETGGVLSLVALPEGCLEPDVVMFGHIDVVHHPNRESYRSELADGRIYGPGTGDMKGIVAILLELFRFFHLQSPGVPLGLAITTDEEIGGENGTKALLEEHGLRCKVGMVPDGGSLDEVVVEEKGILHLHLESTGAACHAARPWLGKNALARIVATIEDILRLFPPGADPDHWYATCAVTSVNTPNRSFNRVPSHAAATLDIRYPHPIKAGDLVRKIGAVLGDGVTATPVMSAAPNRLSPDPAFFDACQAILGHRPHQRREHGGSDARFLAAHNIPVIMSRPLCGKLHSKKEWIDIDSMVTFYAIYQKYLQERFQI